MNARLKLVGALFVSATMIVGLVSCASAPVRPAAAPSAAASTAPGQASAEPSSTATKEVAWDPAVWADFQKDVPRFVRALAKDKIEEMARERGSYFVDRALYNEAMAEYKR